MRPFDVHVRCAWCVAPCYSRLSVLFLKSLNILNVNVFAHKAEKIFTDCNIQISFIVIIWKSNKEVKMHKKEKSVELHNTRKIKLFELKKCTSYIKFDQTEN
jgi:hypothetical protein